MSGQSHPEAEVVSHFKNKFIDKFWTIFNELHLLHLWNTEKIHDVRIWIDNLQLTFPSQILINMSSIPRRPHLLQWLLELLFKFLKILKFYLSVDDIDISRLLVLSVVTHLHVVTELVYCCSSRSVFFTKKMKSASVGYITSSWMICCQIGLFCVLVSSEWPKHTRKQPNTLASRWACCKENWIVVLAQQSEIKLNRHAYLEMCLLLSGMMCDCTPFINVVSFDQLFTVFPLQGLYVYALLVSCESK